MQFNFDIGNVVSEMVRVSADALIKGGRQATDFATREYSQFIRDIEQIQTQAEKGLITAETAQSLVEQHKLSMQAVFLTVEGLVLIAVQNAMNAALKVLNDALTAALGVAFQGLKFAL
jgi:hypothetical protein